VAVVSANALKAERDLDTFATKIVEQAIKAFDNRRDIPRDIPDVKESAVVGFSFKDVDTKRIVEAINGGKIKGVAIFSGSNNIKYTQDNTLLTMAQEFLMNDILCISEGEASVCLAKYGLLNPEQKQNSCGKGLKDLLPTLGDNIPAIIDWRMTDFLLALSNIEKKALKDYPIIACFAEANRSMEVVKALWTVATGVSTYFWPCLPVTGSPKAMNTMAELSNERFGSRLHVITEKIDARAKADLFIQSLKTPVAMSGKSWE
jgi:carbon-monoxide dehydrogenase catalytic subunit